MDLRKIGLCHGRIYRGKGHRHRGGNAHQRNRDVDGTPRRDLNGSGPPLEPGFPDLEGVGAGWYRGKGGRRGATVFIVKVDLRSGRR